MQDVDPLKVVIDVRGTGSTGYAFGQALGSWHDVHPELVTDTTVLFVLGPAERPDDALAPFVPDLQTVFLGGTFILLLLAACYGAAELVGFDAFPEVQRVLDAFVARPAVQRGLEIPKKPDA